MLRILWVVALATPLFVPLAAQAASLITLDQAIDLALASDPTVKASEAGTSASLASLKQAGQLPNPTIGITAENFGGTGSVSGLRSAEYRSEEHTSELQSLMRISYAVFCLKKKTHNQNYNIRKYHTNNT